MAKKFIDGNGLLYFWTKIKAKFVEKVDGKGLSTNDFTDDYKTKLEGISSEADKTTVEDLLTSSSSINALSANQGRILDEKIKGVKDSLTALGSGDMKKSEYDTDNNGKVDKADKADDADKLGGQPSSYYAKASEIIKNFSDLNNDGAVQYTSQALTDTQKAQARENIGAGTSNFSGSYNDLTDKPTNFAPTTHTHTISQVTGLSDALNSKVEKSTVGQASGVASLDENGKVPSTQLPSYVDDVIEGYADTTVSEDGSIIVNGFYEDESHTNSISGEDGKIYIDKSTNLSYRWGGSVFVQITSSDMTALTNTEIDTILAS